MEQDSVLSSKIFILEGSQETRVGTPDPVQGGWIAHGNATLFLERILRRERNHQP